MDEQALASGPEPCRHAEEATTETEKVAATVVIPTARFGEISIPEEQLLSFPQGLVGLPAARRFVFVQREESESPFFWLQAVDDPALAFVVCEPQVFFPDYRVPLSGEDQALLAIHAPEEGIVCVILVVPGDPQQITANLRGPLVINPERRLGIQLVLAGDDYPVRARLFAEDPDGGSRCSS